MADITFNYITTTAIPSCLNGETHLQSGEEVMFDLAPKNPLWDSTIILLLSLPALVSTQDEEPLYLYKFTIAESAFDGTTIPDACDLSNPKCFGCCDSNRIEYLQLIAAQSAIIQDLTTRTEALELIHTP